MSFFLYTLPVFLISLFGFVFSGFIIYGSKQTVWHILLICPVIGIIMQIDIILSLVLYIITVIMFVL